MRGVAHGAWQRSGGPAGALFFFRSWNDEKGVGAECRMRLGMSTFVRRNEYFEVGMKYLHG